jgi:hypothetical protein
MTEAADALTTSGLFIKAALYFSTITLKMDGEGRSFLTELGGLGVVDFGLR